MDAVMQEDLTDEERGDLDDAEDGGEQDKTLFTPEIDRRIFKGCMGDRRLMIEELGREGISERAITRRREMLGLSPSFIAKCRSDGVLLSIRECLSCEQLFVSQGRQNRLCKKCRQKK